VIAKSIAENIRGMFQYKNETFHKHFLTNKICFNIIPSSFQKGVDMNEINAIGQLELSKHLMQIRERAGIKQAELARKLTWSPAVLSRVENGDRQLAPEELQMILEAINTPEAQALISAIQRNWVTIPRPPLDHPDQELLWAAEQVAKELVVLRERPDVRNAFERRLSAYVQEIQRDSGLLLKRDHQVAFIGPIGIGKSTAICRLTGLEVDGKEGEHRVPVLEAGAGGITICEVHLRTGPSYGLMIEPRSEDEVRADVTDFAEYIHKGDEKLADESQSNETDSQGISKEIERAVRNMSGLRIRRMKSADGKTTRKDEGKELGQKLSSVRELVVEVLARMELHKRDRRDIWYDSSSSKPPLVWLKDTFEEVNNGRHPEFTLPKRIEIVLPETLLGLKDLSIRIIDTKGIDRTAARADLEIHLDDPHTIAVLCTGFNNAPAAEPRLLLDRALETGVRTLLTNTALLVLPRPNEALAVKDESGIRVETPEEGYELKSEQVSMALQPLGLQDLAVNFFNSHQDNPAGLRDFLTERILSSRQGMRARLHEITTNAQALLLNHEQEQTQEVVRHAAVMLHTWTTQNNKLKTLKANVEDSLMAQLSRAYASTIRAAVRREGEWPNLSYSHHLGHGARRIATLTLGKTVEGFSELCKTMAANPEYLEARDLIAQAERVLVVSYDELLRKVQLMGQTSFRDELKIDSIFWSQLDNEWGRGPGYRDRVTEHNSDWFRAEPRQTLENELRTLIEREWQAALTSLTSLFELNAD
jgi:transcriptional regulator with XRE-family HTH domain